MKYCIALFALAVLTACSTYIEPDPFERPAHFIAVMTRKECGATWSIERGNESGSGAYVTGAFPEAGEVERGFPDENKLRNFVFHHSSLLVGRPNAVGTWCITPKGDCHAPGPVTCYLDISRETATLDDAAKLATACNQTSIAHLKRDGSVEIIDSYAGHHFGDGSPISGAALQACKKARGE